MRRKSRGVSDVVATIILLAMTVTLFSAIFAFVTTFPAPLAQNSNQFQASLVVSPNGQYATGINITHLAGPTVPTSAQIYLKSSVHPGHCPFSNPIPVWNASSGQGISGSYWTLGQTWGVPFNQICASGNDPLPDNITVYVVNNARLLFSVILPGAQIVTPPQVLSAWTSPSPVHKGGAFTVNAVITGSYLPHSVYLNLANVPNLPTVPVPMVPYQNHWIWNSTGNSTGPSISGTYTGFINVSSANGGSGFGTVTVVVTSSTGNLVVSIGATPTSGTAPLYVAFGATVSGASGSIISYVWTFGDGGTYTSTTSPSATYTYNAPGTYIVTVTVQDGQGNQATGTIDITVT